MPSERATAISNSVYGAATQDPDELAEFLDVLLQDPPRTIIEIGMAFGGTAQAWLKAATDDALLVGVDLEPERARFLVRGDQSAVKIGGNSRDANTIREVRWALGNRHADFLFIDGEHTESAALADFENYGPLVRTGGVVAFHDAAGNDGVKAALASLWQDVTLIHNAAETRHCMGIGWLRVS